MLQISNDIGLVDFGGGKKKSMCGSRMSWMLLDSEPGICFTPDDFEPVTDGDGQVSDWKLRPGFALKIGKHPDGSWQWRLLRVGRKFLEYRGTEPGFATREEALARAAKLFPSVPVLEEDGAYDRMFSERLVTYSSGCPELDQLLGIGAEEKAGEATGEKKD